MKLYAYYNENDENKAAWLRELIRCGIIASGEVDIRSIAEVQPEDLAGFIQCHFFAGIGVWSYALRLAGWPDDRPVWTGSCPCPSFSAAGKGGGFNDPRHLWPDWARLIRKCRPATLFGEQADDAIGYGWLDLVQTDLERENYAVGKAVLGACSVGAPHIRQRLYFVGKRLADPRGEESRRVSGCEREEVAEARSGSENGRMAKSAGPRRAEAWEHGSRPSSLPARLEQRGGDSNGDVQRSGEHGQRQEDGLAGVGMEYSNRRGCKNRRTKSDDEVGTSPYERRTSSDFGATTQESSTSTGRMGDSAQRGLGVCGSAPGNSRRLAFASEIGGMGIADSMLARTARPGDPQSDGSCGELTGPGATNGFWRDADWLWCRDGKYRPVEPGTFPLVTGASNRVLKLRGYGDAICAEVAKAFIEACMTNV